MELSLLTAAMSINTSQIIRVDPITITNLPNETLLAIFARVDFNNDDTHTNIMLVNRLFYNLIRANKTGLRTQIAVLQFSKATMTDFVVHKTASISYSHLQKFKLQTSNVRRITACVGFDSDDPNDPKPVAARRLVAVALHTLATLHELRIDGDSEATNTLLLLLGTEFSRRCSKWLRLACILLWRGIVNTRISLGSVLPLMPFDDSVDPVALEDLAVRDGLSPLVGLAGNTHLDSIQWSNTSLSLSRARDRVQHSLTLITAVQHSLVAQHAGALAPPVDMTSFLRPTHYPTLGALRTADLLLGPSMKGQWLNTIVSYCAEAPGSALKTASAAGSDGTDSGEEGESIAMQTVQRAMLHDWHAEVARAVTQDESLVSTDFASCSSGMNCLKLMNLPLRRFKMLRDDLEAQIRELDMKSAPYGSYMKIHDNFDTTYANKISSGDFKPGELARLQEKNTESLKNAFYD